MTDVKPQRAAWTAIGLGAALALLLGSAPARAGDVSKADWVRVMKTTLPTVFCADGSYFRACFSIDALECERVAVSATRICLDEFAAELPASLGPDAGRTWGTKVGSCAGQSFEVTLLKKRISSPKCNDPKNWGG